MNTIDNSVAVGRTLIAAAVAAVLLAGCAAAPAVPEGASEVRT